MANDGFHGVIFAYSACPGLRELTGARTAASLPFCGRYRLIDFALSSMRNAGVLNVGVIMQRDYQSLLDHLGSGKAWDMSRRAGGLRMLPPFGLAEDVTGNYVGTIEALNAVSTYIGDIQEKYVILMPGNLCANIDLTEPMRRHRQSGAEVTVICADGEAAGNHHRCVLGDDGYVSELIIDSGDVGPGLPSLEGYIINKELLLRLMRGCKERGQYSFHKNALLEYLRGGGRMDACIHHGYAAAIRTVDAYYKASMDMLDSEKRGQLFPADRPVRTKSREEVSTYYGEHARESNCLVADNCIIDGELENCIVFSGVRIARGTRLKSCILFSKCVLGENVSMEYVVADKYCSFSDGFSLYGTQGQPVLVPKRSRL